jgi:hypothetical protein
MFEGVPPVVWAALAGDRLAGYAVTYATGSDAMLEKVFIAPQYRDQHLGLGLYWSVLTGWAQTPGIENCWAGGSMPGGVDSFKIAMGASLEHLPVHAGMRWPMRSAMRWVKPDAVSLAALSV